MIVNSVLSHQNPLILGKTRENGLKKDILTDKTEQIWDSFNPSSSAKPSSRFDTPLILSAREFYTRGIDRKIEHIELLGPEELCLFTEEGEQISVTFKLTFSSQREFLKQYLSQSSIKLIRSSDGNYRIEALPRLLGGGENELTTAVIRGDLKEVARLLAEDRSLVNKKDDYEETHIVFLADSRFESDRK